MKKLNSLLMLAAVAGALTFTSCQKDEVTTTGTVTYSTPTDGKATVPTDTVILVKLTVSAAEDLKSVSAKVAYDGAVGTTLDLSADTKTTDSTLASGTGKTFEWTTGILTRSVAGKEVYTYTFKDKSGNTTEATITLTVNSKVVVDKVVTYSAKLLGGQSNATQGSFFNSSEGLVYNQANAKTNSGKVDILYFYGATNMATIASPDDADAATIYNNSSTGIQTWTTKNATKFKATTVTATEFDGITAKDDSKIVAAAAGAADTKSNKLASGSVFAFVTAAGKKGLIKVTAVSGTQDGSITIDVKVQK